MPRKVNIVKVTRSDGSTYEMPAYDRRTLKLIRENTTLTPAQRATISIKCPVCGARAGRTCRSEQGHRTMHKERLQAYQDRKSTSSRHESGRMGS
jgi:hypothetical protein